MKNFHADLSEIKKIIDPDPNKIPLSGNEHRMVRVAFDVFRLKNNDPEELWQVQSSDDGEFLVRTYTLPEDEIVTSDWSVSEDSKKANLTISYKTIPIKRIAMSNFGITTENDSFIFQRALYNKLSNDGKFVNKMVNSLPKIKQNILKEAGFVNNVDSKLLELEKKLQKSAEIDNIDESFYESGMETYGPGSQSSEGALKDREEEILLETQNLIEDPKVKGDMDVYSKLIKLFSKAYDGDEESLEHLEEILIMFDKIDSKNTLKELGRHFLPVNKL